MSAGCHECGLDRNGGGPRRRFRDELIECGDENFGRYRARKESLSSELQRKSLILGIVVTTRVEDERNALQPFVLLPLTAKREAIHAGQHDVGNDRIGRFASCGIQGRQSVRGLLNLMASARQ
jgi:hypothetical protein